MDQKDAFEPLPFKFLLPCENPRDQYGDGCERRSEQVAIRCRGQHRPPGPIRKKIKEHANDEQGDREMNQHDVLRVFRENHRFNVKRVQGFSSA